MSKKNLNNAQVIDACTQRLTALKQYDPNPAEIISINGDDMKVSEIEAVYQGCLDARAALVSLRTQVKLALAARTAAEAKRRTTDRGLKGWIETKYGPSSSRAHDFGFAPRKAQTPSAETKARAVELRLATRAARHTQGPKQKKHIKGALTALPNPGTPAATAPPEPPVTHPAANGAQAPSSPENGAAAR